MAGGFGKRLHAADGARSQAHAAGGRPAAAGAHHRAAATLGHPRRAPHHPLPARQHRQPLRRRRGIRRQHQLHQRGPAARHGRRPQADARPSGPFVVINGDILTGVAYQDMLRFHRKHGATTHVGVRVHEIRCRSAWWSANDVRVMELREKPSLTSSSTRDLPARAVGLGPHPGRPAFRHDRPHPAPARRRPHGRQLPDHRVLAGRGPPRGLQQAQNDLRDGRI